MTQGTPFFLVPCDYLSIALVLQFLIGSNRQINKSSNFFLLRNVVIKI